MTVLWAIMLVLSVAALYVWYNLALDRREWVYWVLTVVSVLLIFYGVSGLIGSLR